MKSKSYWEPETERPDPFELPRRVSQGINALVREYEESAPPSVVKYLWVYVNEDGIRRRDNDIGETGHLRLDDWLNVIDESASLGAEWMVVHVGASLCQCPEVWKMCEWAQSEYGLKVGLHLQSASLSEDDIEHLTKLDSSKTHIIADKAILDALRPLQHQNVRFCEASVTSGKRLAPCSNPKDLVCVGIDGRLFTCGLVLGEDAYALGSVLERGLKAVLQDETLPHVVPNTGDYPEHGCDGCPPHMAHRVMGILAD